MGLYRDVDIHYFGFLCLSERQIVSLLLILIDSYQAVFFYFTLIYIEAGKVNRHMPRSVGNSLILLLELFFKFQTLFFLLLFAIT